jgi:hypothetical protein
MAEFRIWNIEFRFPYSKFYILYSVFYHIRIRQIIIAGLPLSHKSAEPCVRLRRG